jgi:L-rhamnose mutarotase
MIRKAFVMTVNVGSEAEYAKRHNPIWPELVQILKDHGVHNYSIFFLERTRQLFAYVEVESEVKWAAIAATPVCPEWWRHKAELMPHNPDHSPIAEEILEVFHLD